MRTRLLFLLLACSTLLACEDETAPPVRPPLEPVVRIAALNLVASEATTLSTALATLDDYGPTGLVLSGELSPGLTGGGDPATESALATITAALGTDADVGILVEIPALGADVPVAVCFDPSAPTTDPYLASRAAELAALLDTWPDIDQLVIAPTAAPAPWEVDCTCSTCDSTAADGQADRMLAAHDALATATDSRGTQTWWWDSLVDDPVVFDAAEAMDLALDGLGAASGVRVRAAPYRGPGHTWAPVSPRLSDASSREVAADLDLLGAVYGDTDALLLFPDRLHDRVRSDRADGIVAWFAALDGGGRTVWGSPEEANLYFVARLFRELALTPEQLLQDHVDQRYGLDPASDEGVALVAALRHTGRAMEVATHPLGVAVSDPTAPPAALPLTFADPRAWDDRWAGRWEALAFPSEQTMVDVNQWGAEGVDLSGDALASLADAEVALSEADAAELRRGLTVLHAATRSWKLALGADITLKVWQSEASEPLATWLRQDADEMDALAAEIDAALAAGTILDPFPADPDGLRAIALQLRSAVGGGDAADRPFPTVTEVHWDFEEDRANVHWTLRPGGLGWWERGPGWPEAYDDPSATGAEPAVFWHGWTRSLASGSRTSFRACGESNGFRVCSSDNVFWTPQ